MAYQDPPFIPGEISKLLRQDPHLQDLLHGGKISCRQVPDPLVAPHITVQTVASGAASKVLRTYLIQVTPWVPDNRASGLSDPPELTAWNLASHAGKILTEIKNHVIGQFVLQLSWADGPIQLTDTARGKDRPIFYAPIRLNAKLVDHQPLPPKEES